ncbi:MAG: response regulator transcription factor [Bacilli bacterium]|jgi:two-component system alkaline phosphatase synthesis response regulator PhoP
MDFLIYSIEDDKDIALIINKTLSKQGYVVKTYYNARTFFKAFNEEKPHIILLDMMLPDMSGQEILKKIRSDSSNDDIEIIIISANHMIMDKVDGFDLGADDYIEKPFDLLELMSRVAAKTRRFKRKKVFDVNGVILDVNSRTCLVDNKDVELTNKEFDILTLLLEKDGDVATREELFQTIWESDQIVESRTLDMHIKSIRSKFGDKHKMIKTVYGLGYKIQK